MSATRPGDRRVLTFTTSGLAFAISIESVREVITSTDIQRLANVPAYIVGVLHLRGTVIPVIDLRVKLNLGPNSGPGRKVLIIQARNGVAGLLVDDVRAVVKPGEDGLQPMPDGLPQIQSRLFLGILRLENELVTLLDVSGVLLPSEEGELASLASMEKQPG